MKCSGITPRLSPSVQSVYPSVTAISVVIVIITDKDPVRVTTTSTSKVITPSQIPFSLHSLRKNHKGEKNVFCSEGWVMWTLSNTQRHSTAETEAARHVNPTFRVTPWGQPVLRVALESNTGSHLWTHLIYLPSPLAGPQVTHYTHYTSLVQQYHQGAIFLHSVLPYITFIVFTGESKQNWMI